MDQQVNKKGPLQSDSWIKEIKWWGEKALFRQNPQKN